MLKRVFQPILVALVACTLMLSGCGDSDETKSKNLLSQAETLMQQDNKLQAEKILTDLVARYPGTQSEAIARKHLDRIQVERDLREREGFAKVLESYQKVLDGYQALYAEYPRSVSALDQSEYFFDSAYLEGVTPDGYQVYLWLKSDGSGYRLWCVNQGRDHGYSVEVLNRNLVPFKRDEILKTLKARFRTTTWDGKVIALQVQNESA